jgi:hypothetical protein
VRFPRWLGLMRRWLGDSSPRAGPVSPRGTAPYRGPRVVAGLWLTAAVLRLVKWILTAEVVRGLLGLVVSRAFLCCRVACCRVVGLCRPTVARS